MVKRKAGSSGCDSGACKMTLSSGEMRLSDDDLFLIASKHLRSKLCQSTIPPKIAGYEKEKR